MFGLNGRELRFAFVISSSHFAQHFLMRLIPPLIPVLAVAMTYPLWQLGLLVGIFSLGSGLAQAPMGILSDEYDRLYILPTGIVVAGGFYILFAAAGVVGVFVPDLSVAGLEFEGRFIVMCLSMLGVGLGAAVVHPTAYPLITANVSEDNRGKVFGSFGSFSKIGDATAPATIGLLILVLVWHQIVTLLGVASIVVGMTLYIALRRDEFETAPLSRENHDDEEPNDNRSERDNRTFLYPILLIYVFFIGKMFSGNGLNTFVPVFVTGVYAYSLKVGSLSLGPDSVANFYFSALLLSAAASQLLLGGAIDRYDSRSVILVCLGVATIGLLVFATVDLSPLLLLLVMVLIGGSLWGTNPARDDLISRIAPTAREGRTFGYLWTAAYLTGSMIPAVLGYIIEKVGHREGFATLAAGTLLAFVSISLLFSKHVYVDSADRESIASVETSD